MKPWIDIEVEPSPLERVGVDLAVVGFFEDERPLRGGAGLADWRLCGWLSELCVAGEARGRRGERILVPTLERLRSPRLLLLGLGARREYDLSGLGQATEQALDHAFDLGSGSALLDLPSPLPEPGPGEVAQALLRGVAACAERRQTPLWLRLVPSPEAADALRQALRDALRRLGTPAVRIQTAEPEPAPRRVSGARRAARPGSA